MRIDQVVVLGSEFWHMLDAKCKALTCAILKVGAYSEALGCTMEELLVALRTEHERIAEAAACPSIS